MSLGWTIFSLGIGFYAIMIPFMLKYTNLSQLELLKHIYLALSSLEISGTIFQTTVLRIQYKAVLSSKNFMLIEG